jgi:hypothetical protein
MLNKFIGLVKDKMDQAQLNLISFPYQQSPPNFKLTFKMPLYYMTI